MTSWYSYLNGKLEKNELTTEQLTKLKATGLAKLLSGEDIILTEANDLLAKVNSLLNIS